MSDLLYQPRCFGAADVVGGVGSVGGAYVLADLLEMQGMFRLANEVGYLSPDLAASDGFVGNDDGLGG